MSLTQLLILGMLTQSAPVVSTTVVTLAEGRAWCRVDDTTDDAIIAALLSAAQRHVESRLGFSLLTVARTMTVDRFSGGLNIYGGPNLTVTAIKYRDAAGAVQTVPATDYVVDASNNPARIDLAAGKIWPSTISQIGAVTIEYTLGWASAALVPDDLKLAMQLLVAHWYINREAVVVGTINSRTELAFDTLLNEYRSFALQ